MRILLYGKKSDKILPLVEKMGFEIIKENPEMVLAYGGDGALMKAEFDFPGIPKVLLRDSEVCKKCPPYPNEVILKKLEKGEYRIQNMTVLEVKVGEETKRGINDIIIHNSDPRRAIRYNLWIDGKKIGERVIGDGIVVATPYGSTGYYRSITKSFFDVGIGLAFNNSTEQFDHMVLNEETEIKVEIIRGPADVLADNQRDRFVLNDGDKAVIQKSSEVARILVFT